MRRLEDHVNRFFCVTIEMTSYDGDRSENNRVLLLPSLEIMVWPWFYATTYWVSGTVTGTVTHHWHDENCCLDFDLGSVLSG